MRFMLSLAAAAAAAILFLGCGSTEEVSENDPQALASSPAVATPTPTPAPTPTASATPVPTPAPTPSGITVDTELGPAVALPPPTPLPDTTLIPDGWATFSNANLVQFSFRYPADWFSAGGGGVSSWDPNLQSAPPDGISVGVQLASLEFAEERPPEAIDTTMYGQPGWEAVYAYDAPTRDRPTRVHVVAIDVPGYRLFIIGSFIASDPDEQVFLQILASLELSK